jgi:hypothetical protein
MTPQEIKKQADEIANQFYEGSPLEHTKEELFAERKRACKRALIAVRMVLESEPTYYGVEKSHKYWQAIETELKSRIS